MEKSYLRKITPIQREPFEPIFQHVAHMAESILPDGQDIGNDPVNCEDRTRQS